MEGVVLPWAGWWAHLDSVTCPVFRAHLPHLTHVPLPISQVLQVVDLRLVALAREPGLRGSSRPLPLTLAHISQLCRAHPPWGHQGKSLGYLARWSGSGLLHDLLQLLVNLDAERRGGVPVEGVLTNVRLPQPPTCRGFHRAHQCHPEAGPARPDLPTIHQGGSPLHAGGVNKVDGNPSMWRGRAEGVGGAAGALRRTVAGCPHRWPVGAAGLGVVRTRGWGGG